MNQQSSALLDVHAAEASSVIVHHVPAAMADKFLQWERGITEAAEQFPGYAKTEVYPPADRQQTEWVVVVHFDGREALKRWLDSPERACWIAKLGRELGRFSIKALPRGFGSWFAGLDREGTGSEQAAGLPPDWKMALVVLLGLYPTVMLLTLFVSPWLAGLGLAFSMLIGNALSVSILQWGILPRLTAALRRWLSPPARNALALNVGGTLTILALLGCVAVLFHQFGG